MPLNTMRDLLIQELNELYAAERHCADVLPKLAKAASDAKLGAEFRQQSDECREHRTRLDKVFQEMGVPHPPADRGESRGMKGLLRDCLNLAAMKKAEAHVRDAALIAVAQHVIHDAIAGYGCARTWAQLLGLDSVGDLLQKTLEQERAADRRLTVLSDSLNRAALETAAA